MLLVQNSLHALVALTSGHQLVLHVTPAALLTVQLVDEELCTQEQGKDINVVVLEKHSDLDNSSE